jgi:hypothetical protein
LVSGLTIRCPISDCAPVLFSGLYLHGGYRVDCFAVLNGDSSREQSPTRQRLQLWRSRDDIAIHIPLGRAHEVDGGSLPGRPHPQAYGGSHRSTRVPYVRTSGRGPKTMGEAHHSFSFHTLPFANGERAFWTLSPPPIAGAPSSAFVANGGIVFRLPNFRQNGKALGRNAGSGVGRVDGNELERQA